MQQNNAKHHTTGFSFIKKSIFSVVVLKHTISKRNSTLSWHTDSIKKTSVTPDGQVSKDRLWNCFFLILFTFDVNKFFLCKVWRQFQCKEKWNYWFSILFWLAELIAQEFQKQKRRSISSESAGSAHSKTSCCFEIWR